MAPTTFSNPPFNIQYIGKRIMMAKIVIIIRLMI